MGRFPDFRLGTADAPKEFVDEVMGILEKLNYNDRNFFTEMQSRFFEIMKQIGFGEACRNCFSPEDTQKAILLMNPGHSLFQILEERGTLLRYLPFNDVTIVPYGQDFLVKFDSLERRNSKYGTMYFSRARPSVMLEGRPWTVSFSRHAIERVCERVVHNWKTYAGFGDAFWRYAKCTYFEPASVRKGEVQQPAFTFYDGCENGFATESIRDYICPHCDASKRYAFRLGYCPVGFVDDEFAHATTLLYPGMNGTPEHDLLVRSALPTSTINRFVDLLEEISYKKVAQSDEPLEVLKWFHDNGIPQIVEKKW